MLCRVMLDAAQRHLVSAERVDGGWMMRHIAGHAWLVSDSGSVDHIVGERIASGGAEI